MPDLDNNLKWGSGERKDLRKTVASSLVTRIEGGNRNQEQEQVWGQDVFLWKLFESKLRQNIYHITKIYRLNMNVE